MTDLPEAPVSQTIKLSYKGCEILLTQRSLEEKMKPYLEQAKILIEGALSMGFEAPPARGGFPKKEVKYVEGKVCGKCGSRLVEKKKADGHIFFKCEKNVWDPINKKPTGCDYIDWNNPVRNDPMDDYMGTDQWGN